MAVVTSVTIATAPGHTQGTVNGPTKALQVHVTGVLDEKGLLRLGTVCAVAATGAVRSVDLDLTGITGFTDDAARALGRYLQRLKELPEGFSVQASGPTSRALLLAAFLDDGMMDE